MTRTRTCILTTAVAFGLCVPAATAYSWFQYGGYDVVWASNQSLRFMSPSTFPPASATETLYLNALGLWMLVPSSDFAYFYDYYEPTEIDPYDGYSDTVAVPAEWLDPGVLGVTYMVNNGPQWYDMDQLFSDFPAGVGWNFEGNPSCDSIANPTMYGYSFLLTATHELGHALGLGHDPQGTEPPGSPWFIGTMNPRYPCGGPIGVEAIVEVHADDRNGIRYLYPHSGQAQPVVDLANGGYVPGTTIGRAVPAAVSPATVYPGGVITLPSTIENFGNTHCFNVRQGFYLSVDEIIDTGDLLLGDLRWDLALGDGFQFEAEADMPADLAAGTWYVGSILDDLDEVIEEYEDNNVHAYCVPLTVGRLTPQVEELGQDIAPCGEAYIGPTPVVTHPLNMAPLTWSLDSAPPGLTINPTTGVVTWPSPIRSPFPYTIIIRATNTSGYDTVLFFLGVEQGLPQMLPISNQSTPAGQAYTGPTPVLADGPCMQPILNWSLDAGPDGMTIDHSTGVVAWARARYRATPYAIAIRATNAIGNGTVTFNLTVTGCVGDLNCDGHRTFDDIKPFALALGTEAAYFAQYPNCDPGLADCSGNGLVGFEDIKPFAALIGVPCP